MALDRGMVTEFDGEYGEIIKDNEKYIFLKQDILNVLNTGDVVSFKGEEVHGIKRAYFVESLYYKELPNAAYDKQKKFIDGDNV